jgi:hypothetical protein
MHRRTGAQYRANKRAVQASSDAQAATALGTAYTRQYALPAAAARAAVFPFMSICYTSAYEERGEGPGALEARSALAEHGI